MDLKTATNLTEIAIFLGIVAGILTAINKLTLAVAAKWAFEVLQIRAWDEEAKLLVVENVRTGSQKKIRMHKLHEDRRVFCQEAIGMYVLFRLVLSAPFSYEAGSGTSDYLRVESLSVSLDEVRM